MIIRIVICLSLAFLSSGLMAKKAKEKIIYKYKKYQKFDFEDLVIEGESGGPGDLSIDAPKMRGFRGKLPYRYNFNPEIRKAIERVR